MSVSDDKSTGGTKPYHQPEADQAERRAVLRQDQAARTYLEMETARDEGGPAVIGASPPQLAVPQWSRDLAALPKEPPLGEDINEVNDTEACWWQPGAVGPKGTRNDEA